MTDANRNYDLESIAGRFQLYGQFVSGEPYGSGHINDTFAIALTQGGTPVRYILQRINHNVFRQPEVVQANIERVTSHQRDKLAAHGHGDLSRRALTLIPTHEGMSYYRDGDGNYWRVYIFIESAQTYDQIQSTDQAYRAARSFGEFVNQLSDIPERLEETIPDFHNTPARFEVLKQAIEADAHNRAAGAADEIEYALSQAPIVGRLVDLNRQGLIPERVTHNDTKLNNVMIDDETGEGICVIDLDTVMPGLSLYDFGDMVRTAARPTAEDERDLDKVVADLSMYEALARGYVETLGSAMTPEEKRQLPFSAQLITYEIGIRFLTDYLQGDVYFKTHREGHNIDRCRTQFKMAQEFDRNMETMQRFAEGLQ